MQAEFSLVGWTALTLYEKCTTCCPFKIQVHKIIVVNKFFMCAPARKGERFLNVFPVNSSQKMDFASALSSCLLGQVPSWALEWLCALGKKQKYPWKLIFEHIFMESEV